VNAELLRLGSRAIGCDLLFGSEILTARDACLNPEIYADVWHPNDVGHILISRAALQAIQVLGETG
jgi:hypothetical protein